MNRRHLPMMRSACRRVHSVQVQPDRLYQARDAYGQPVWFAGTRYYDLLRKSGELTTPNTITPQGHFYKGIKVVVTELCDARYETQRVNAPWSLRSVCKLSQGRPL